MKFISFIILVVLAGSALCEEAQAIKAVAEKKEDEITVVTDEGGTQVCVVSKTGIGTGSLTLESGVWPKKLVIRLKLGTLESFGMDNGKDKFLGALPKPDSSSKDIGDDYPIVKRGEWIEVIVPDNLLDDELKKISFSWIDAWRR